MKTLISFLVLFTLLTARFAAHADNITVQGTVSGHWYTDTVFVAGHLRINDGQNLMIHSGVRVIFTGMYEISVEGSMSVYGTEADSIYFLVADTTGFGVDTIPDGGWRGIRFDHNRASNDSSVFLFCHFAHGKMVSDDEVTGHGGVFYVNDYGKVRIGRSLFNHNFSKYHGGAVYLDSANVVIHDCVFRHNRCGLSVAPWGYGGAVCSDNSSPEIRGNVFEYNASTGIGGGLAVRYVDCNVYGNRFENNFSALGGGFGFLHMTEANHRISNNLVAGNAVLFFGGGVANVNAAPVYINNTIVFNSATYGGGFYCKDSVSPDFYNTIIWGNTAAVGPQGYLFEVYSQADFFNCVVEGGPVQFGGSGGGEAFLGAYEACIEDDPLFEGTGLHPYALTAGSPCIDAGSADTTGFFLPQYDLAGNPRVSGGRIDIGAYEFMVTGVESPETLSLVVFPNPTRGKFQITNSKHQTNSKFQAPNPKFQANSRIQIQNIEVVDLYGKVVKEIVCDLDLGACLEFGAWDLEFDITRCPAGIYFIRIYLGDQVLVKRVVKATF